MRLPSQKSRNSSTGGTKGSAGRTDEGLSLNRRGQLSAEQRNLLRGMATSRTVIVAAFVLLFVVPLCLGTVNTLSRGSLPLLDLLLAAAALGLMIVIGLPFLRSVVALYRDLRAGQVVKDCGALAFDRRLSPLTRVLGSGHMYVTLDGQRRYRSAWPLPIHEKAQTCLYVTPYSGLIMSAEP